MKSQGGDLFAKFVKANEEAKRRFESQRGFPTATYALKIMNWKLDYSFGVRYEFSSLSNFDSASTNAFSEDLQLRIRCQIMAPMKITGRETVVIVKFRKYLDGEQCGFERLPTLIGEVVISRGKYDFDVVLPHDVAAPIVETLAAGRFQYIQIDVKPMSRASHIVKHCTFTSELREEDFWD